MAFSNVDKQQHGKNALRSIASTLELCKENGYLTDIHKNYRIGKRGYTNKKQFYAPFLIEFSDGTKWAIFSTTSMRTDRIKGQQWDAVNLKELNTTIERFYLVYPDETPDKDLFEMQNSKYVSNVEYSAIDAIVSQDTLKCLIVDYANKDKSGGQKKDILGKDFEVEVANILNYSDNLKILLTNDKTLVGNKFKLFKHIIDCFELEIDNIKGIHATADKNKIGVLPTGGSPKTDVLVKVEHADGSITYHTISCKRTSSTRVSIHQYKARDFANVLDPDDDELRELLEEFQIKGNMRDFGEANCARLTEKLRPYREQLAYWALGGVGGGGDCETQWARFILCYDNNDDTATVHSLATYCDTLLHGGYSGNFGTPFSWTLASGQRGKTIQLKCPILK
jgi:hypothetical protein